MTASSRLDSFVTASQFCTGSQTDYSTCIVNNMKFMEFLTDEYKASSELSVSIQSRPLPVVVGKSYSDLIPLAMANVVTRIKTMNDFGVVDFRCSEVFNRPRLPLLRLQDVGIRPIPFSNIKGLDMSDDSATETFEGVPIGPDHYLNGINLTIGYGNFFSKVISTGEAMIKIIEGSLDYNALPAMSEEYSSYIVSADRVYNKLFSELYSVDLNTVQGNFIYESFINIGWLLNAANGYLQSKENLADSNETLLSVITPATDWTTFDYSITEQVKTNLELEKEYVETYELNTYAAKQISSISGTPPNQDSSDSNYQQILQDSTNKTMALYINMVSGTIAALKRCYQSSNIDTIIASLLAYEAFNDYVIQNHTFWLQIPKADLTDPLYLTMIDSFEQLADIFTFTYNDASILDTLAETAYEDRADLLDDYLATIGDPSSIALAKLVSDRGKATHTTTDDRLTEYNMGGSFKDSGEFFYADLAYAVGYGKMTDIHSIQIDDELYSLSGGISSTGTPITGVSESGCVRYRFTRHVLPTYDVEINMYIYPGTPDQPYCPTVNKYHNFATSKYSGMFSKLTAEGLMGVYTFKGYRPMEQTVEEIMEIGTLDINAINLNDPSIDKGSYEAMMQIEAKNLTNASSIISDGTITSEDFKYYLTSELVHPEKANNYPGLIIVEFKHFPLGSSFKFPKIRLLSTMEDPVGAV